MSPSETTEPWPKPADVSHVAALGGGVIGQSWIALFLAAGKTVALYDPDPTAGDRVREAVERAWPALRGLGLTTRPSPPDRLTICDDARAAVDGADFVQESVPERLDVKHELYELIEPVLGETALVASSASGLTLSELQRGWTEPARLVLGHPFNPPHLIPLVEVMGNEATDARAVPWARRFYETLGKVTIEVKREVPGHVANRLQAALWREAIHLVNEGVASVEDVDAAVSAGPGLRWAAMGPTLLFHLGAGEGGLEAFCDRYSESFHRWWDDLGAPRLDASTVERLVLGLAQAKGNAPVEDLAEQRDALIRSFIAAKGRVPPT
ncbi:3-hydroxyacyl-CoA dehydrogenase NAD-binding domain-containing protein [Streptomyces carpinensis]|uniref:3-hydroxyacyl-CoA dehydrogenase NAD-binding domain-containing protein n=1 Tax=Streptomyces carpinensis TaxID=66369 RepID=A0ABV1VUM7_9ACTN|nr:3-hydroxyacyl-CoA dehydrogenase NAD-binding domain-containing protein [Streptomyces carpinensis]